MHNLYTEIRSTGTNVQSAINWSRYLYECYRVAKELGISFETMPDGSRVAEWHQAGLDLQVNIKTDPNGWAEVGLDRYGYFSFVKSSGDNESLNGEDWIEKFIPAARCANPCKAKHAQNRAKTYGEGWHFLTIQCDVCCNGENLGFAETIGFESDSGQRELIEEVLTLAHQAIEEAEEKLSF